MMNYRAEKSKKSEELEIPTAWQLLSTLYESFGIFLELILLFPLYILTKLGFTNIIPTLLSGNVALGPAFVAAAVTMVACSVGIGLGVGLGVGLTCSHNDTLMNNTLMNNTITTNITSTTNSPMFSVGFTPVLIG
ncbi:unnamed protein product [Adineta steineri]|uniref:Uncharacterized protein n=1 Tax=Adineta steineri TaxID=433720 RepID=A0A815FF37_9BILA|nr:unnamed protein product [Adineta steineri]CAF1322623.1 unnamed protein product [Adineta steineri]CAF1325051.1 unnamed protein product [Adineta steineri]